MFLETQLFVSKSEPPYFLAIKNANINNVLYLFYVKGTFFNKMLQIQFANRV